MTFDVSPSDYTPIYDNEIIYRILDAEENDVIDVMVMNTVGKALGVKRFKGGDDIAVNVTDIMRANIEPLPQPRNVCSILYPQDNRFLVSRLRVDGRSNMTEYRVFNAAMMQTKPLELLSRLPLDSRRLGENEWDEISFNIDVSQLRYMIKVHGKVDFTMEVPNVVVNKGMATFVIAGEHIAAAAVEAGTSFDECRAAEVGIYFNEKKEYEVKYELYDSSKEGMRIAWLNPLGGVDYLTLPKSTSEIMKIAKERMIPGEEHINSIVGLKSECTKEIVIGYKTESETEIFGEILASPRVWRITDRAYTPIDVLTDEVILRSDSLPCIKLVIKDNPCSIL